MIVDYDFTEMTTKDVFKMKLQNGVPDFGYITNKKRVPFLKFLVDNNLVTQTTEIEHDNKYYGRFMPRIDFRFSRLFDYSPKPVIAIRNSMLYTDRSNRLGNWRFTKHAKL